ncbi:uncharacterized protein BDZ99DRAFT_464841 [Mytilinidion resinicola]|uniref:Uncharacterized protein n=1 Tax=Mytilinidion resinicola TaxID=574789 RepID=A0A6A6YGK6_9PEZI|nr:uncharacterized protein BDZ99DRAFT_464841 [Mytilinidion resinicola]KAF2807942.1 hypothetical protein BDZ99DRAFT_464841 [Mytilinidion resinicola]
MSSRYPPPKTRSLPPAYGRYPPEHDEYGRAIQVRSPHNAAVVYDDSRYFSSAPRSEPRRSGRSVHFDKALIQLAEGYEAAEPVITEFKAGFDQEMGAIKMYADDEILDRLWHARVQFKPKADQRKGKDQEDQSEENGSEEELLAKSKDFQKSLQSLIRGLESSMNAMPTLQSKPKLTQKEKENVERVVKKLRPASEECLKLARQAGKRVTQLQELLKELAYLKLMIDEWPEFTSPESRRRNDESFEEGEDYDNGSREDD